MTQSRLLALRGLLEKEQTSTQEELREQLERKGFEVTQSTVSRDLRRMGAIKMTDADGRTVYRLAGEAAPPSAATGLANLVIGLRENGAMIVVHTTPGSASLIARHIDQMRSAGVLGTIAGDDTIFVAPQSLKDLKPLVEKMKALFWGASSRPL